MFNIQKLHPLAAACTTLLASLAVQAQEASAPAKAAAAAEVQSLETVVVTSQRRRETIQSVPASITSIPAVQLERQGISSIGDLGKVSPSLEFAAPGVQPGGGAVMRGLGTQVQSSSGTPSVGFVLDGVAQGNLNSNLLFDIARVEVLKGPQGTLFGASVSSGVINVTTNAPDPNDTAFSVKADLAPKGASEYGYAMLGAMANIPLSTSSAIRIAAQFDKTKGVLHNNSNGEDSKKRNDAVRVRYLNKLTSDVTLNLSGDYERRESDNGVWMTVRSLGSTAPPAQIAAYTACGITPGPDNRLFCSDVPIQNNNQELAGATAQLDWDLGTNTLSSVTSYRKSSDDATGDVYGLPTSYGQYIRPGVIDDPVRTHRRQLTQEFRLSSPTGQAFEYVTGLYYQTYTGDRVQPVYSRVPTPFGLVQIKNIKTYATESDEVALFGQGTARLGDATKLIVGLRYTRSGLDASMTEAPNLLMSPTVNSASVSGSKTNVSYRLGLQHDLSANAMVFGSVSRGYKASVVADAGPATLAIVRPELPSNIEVGVKSSWFNNRLAANITVFHTKLKDFHGQVCSTTLPPVCVPTNISEVVSKGVEIDVFGQPMRGLNLNLGLAYNPVKYPVGYLGSDNTNIGGTQMTRAAKVKATLSAQYETMWTETLSGFIGGDAVYRSRMSLFPSALPDVTFPAHWTFGLQMGVQNPAEGWKLSLYGRNLTRERLPRDMFPLGSSMVSQWFTESAMRTVGVKFDKDF